MVRLSTIATPRKMNTPRPPAPIAAAMVASPMPMTVASAHAREDDARGERQLDAAKQLRVGHAEPRPASRTAGSTPVMPTTVFRSTGSSA